LRTVRSDRRASIDKRRWLARAGISALAVVGGAATLASPASAAPRGSVTAAHLTRSAASVAAGGSVRLTGSVTYTNGVHINSLPTQLQELTRKGWHTIATKSMSRAGWVTYTVTPDMSRQYRLYFPTWSRNGHRLAASVSRGAGVTLTYAKGSSRATRVVAEAKRHIGARYSYGAAGPSRFDCSGFTEYVYHKVGVSLPHKAASQHYAGHAVSRAQARPGDLVVFSQGGTWSHVGIYLGNGYIIHAPHPGSSVQIQKLWTSAVVYRRLV
jgi:cell wall-associated NlpC family hydrolase